MPDAPFSVDQLLQDPLTRLVMQADNIDEADLRRVLEDAARAIGRDRRTKRWPSIRRADPPGLAQ